MPREHVAADTGFKAEALDPVISATIDRLTKAVADVEKIRSTLAPYLDEIHDRLCNKLLALADDAAGNREAMSDAEHMIEWLEKYARTVLNLTKVVDEASRLRSFVAGGADSRPDLGELSDSQLAKVIQDAAGKLPEQGSK